MAFVEANIRNFFSKVRAQLKPSLTLEKFKDTIFLIFYKKNFMVPFMDEVQLSQQKMLFTSIAA